MENIKKFKNLRKKTNNLKAKFGLMKESLKRNKRK